MEEYLGIFLIDKSEIILRIYKIGSTKWQLLHSSKQILTTDQQNSSQFITQTLISFFSATYARNVADWRICARNIKKEIIYNVTRATHMPIEVLDTFREQELLCRGLCTEFW